MRAFDSSIVRRLRFRRSVVAAGWAALFLGGVLVAAEPSPGGPPPFELSTRTEYVVGHAPFIRAFVGVGAGEFSVLVPSDHIAVLRGTDTLLVASADNVSSITVTRVSIGSRTGKEPTTEEFRAATLEQFPGAAILEETRLGAGDRQGPAFDLRWTGPGRGQQYVRVAYVPSPLGLLRFVAATTEGRDARARSDLSTIMGTFMAGSRGKLVVPELSSQF